MLTPRQEIRWGDSVCLPYPDAMLCCAERGNHKMPGDYRYPFEI